MRMSALAVNHPVCIIIYTTDYCAAPFAIDFQHPYDVVVPTAAV